MKRTIIIKDREFHVEDFRSIIKDYRLLAKIPTDAPKPDFIPVIDLDFFESQGYSLPVVKLDESTYIFPTNAKCLDKSCGLDDLLALCVTDIDLLLCTQNYYYQLARNEYEKNPKIYHYHRIIDEKWAQVQRTVSFRKRGSNSMSWVQSCLAEFIYGKDDKWRRHCDLQDEIQLKHNDLKFQIEEIETTYSIGEKTSYGPKNCNDDLVNDYGVRVKLQNGKEISSREITMLKGKFDVLFSTFKNLSPHFKKYGIIISYSRDTLMHARDAAGVFISDFPAIGVSNRGNISRTLAHEVGHFIDFCLGQARNRHYASDEKFSLTGEIAATFRRSMRKSQSSEYLNRTKECFARAMEQYFCIRNGISIAPKETMFCDPEVFEGRVRPLVDTLLSGL